MRKSDVVKHFGTQQAVANALGITNGAVWQWREELPTDRQAQLELITGGALKASLPNRGKFKKAAALAGA